MKPEDSLDIRGAQLAAASPIPAVPPESRSWAPQSQPAGLLKRAIGWRGRLRGQVRG